MTSSPMLSAKRSNGCVAPADRPNQIALLFGRHRSTIGRELRRNSLPSRHWPAGCYSAARAIELTSRRRRRGRGRKLARASQGGAASCATGLRWGWSPEQIADRLARQHGRTIISHESIYRFVYHRTAQKDYWNDCCRVASTVVAGSAGVAPARCTSFKTVFPSAGDPNAATTVPSQAIGRLISCCFVSRRDQR
jgi:hypothetical protein